MLKVRIVAIGTLKERYLQQGLEEFVKRLRAYCNLQIIEATEQRLPDNPSEKQLQQALEKEGEQLLKHIPNDAYCIVLDLHGDRLSSEKLASILERLPTTGVSEVAFVIGGAFGLGNNIRTRAQLRWSLSELTFTHQMVRLLLVEQNLSRLQNKSQRKVPLVTIANNT